ncbi:Ni/Fe-hydrogenase cytochrome b subunit [bacterium]|nr:Ni/Fe-hydrogenase cytochrome b subunit [bacterium]
MNLAMEIKQVRHWSTSRKIFWGIIGLILLQGLYFSAVRFFSGLGAVTNLTDEFPWGFWIAFDVIGGVALASGGFTLAFLVYIMGYHRYHSVVRPTILTAFLGYILVSVGLIYDLGKYFNIWHPLVMWNPHSVMFEVAWCVMLYSIVLFLEFLPVVLEKYNLSGPLRLLQKITIPVVLLGVLLSTLHQSSLGSVYLIVPAKLHQLWYTPILPLLFFLSAVTVGPAMVILESAVSARLFHRGLETHIIADLADFQLVGIIVYLGVKIQDLFVRDVFGCLASGQFECFHFWGEILLLVMAMLILMIPGMRRHPKWIIGSATLTVLGILYNRFNVAWTGMLRSSGGEYTPAVGEIGISLFLVALGLMAFYFIAKWLPIFPELKKRGEG